MLADLGCLGRVKGQGGDRAWGLVVAPGACILGKVTQASVSALPGRDRWVEGISETPAPMA